MISWMQKHNKYLVWTIWVATIAFIGAGFVGWGSYDFGAKAGNIAKVGSIEIPQSKLNMVYSDVYEQTNQMMQGKLDDKQAKELGLVKRAFSTLNTQAKILNFAKDAGIIVSDKEIANTLENIKAFQKDGSFNKDIYKSYLTARRLKANVFEERLREDLKISKTISLLTVDALPLEIETVSSAMNVADKLAYSVLTADDVNFTLDNTKLKTFWETQKNNFMTKKAYEFSVIWTESTDTNVTDDEVKTFWEANTFNYAGADGKQLSFSDAKEQAKSDLKLKKTKKAAQKTYIALKKGKIKSTETLKLDLNDPKLTTELWSEIQQKNIGDILKPKVIESKYATLKIEAIKEPKVKTFEEAKSEVTVIYIAEEKKNALSKLAENALKDFNESNATMSEFITLEKHDNLKRLNSQESLQFIQKLFTSTKEKGIINLSNKIIVYSVVEQKLLPMDDNKTDLVKQTVNQVKQNIFESNLIKELDKKYPTEVYMEGLTN
jgi:peptidyl-prolyl cis-trans isomerase D